MRHQIQVLIRLDFLFRRPTKNYQSTHVEVADVNTVHVEPELETTIMSGSDKPGRVYSGDISLYPRPGGFKIDEVPVHCVESVISAWSCSP